MKKCFLILLSCVFLSTNLAFAECKYKLKEDSFKIEWTGFKTTEKKGVQGSFLNIMAAAPKNYQTIKRALESSVVSIDTLTVKSGNDARDMNLINYFFTQMKKDTIVRAFISNASDEVNGKATLNLMLNAMNKKIPVHYETSEDGKFTLKAKINILDFGLKNALKSLNKACFELHKGPDHVSKTWPEVEILITAELDKSC